jgi:threonine dehydrogenase-like Zn-dependent dehydrogenase
MVTGSSGFALRHFHEAYRMIGENPAAYRQLITREFPMEQATEAFDLLAQGRTFKVMLKP